MHLKLEQAPMKEAAMYNRILSLAAALCVVGPSATNAATPLPSGPEPSAIETQFFDDLERGDAAAAYHYAFRETESVLGTSNVENLAAQTQGAIKNFGSLETWTLFKKKQITPTFFQDVFYVKFGIVPMFVELQFYKPNDHWLVTEIQIGTYRNAITSGYVDETDAAP